MSVDSKSLAPAQEQDIARKLGNAARLTPQAFAAKAITQPFFCRWYRPRYQAEPVLEKITDAVRAAYMVAWEAELRTEYARDNERDALNDDDPPDNDGAPRRHRDRENDDDVSAEDDDDGEDIGPDSTTGHAPPLAPTKPGAPFPLRDGRVFIGGTIYASMDEFESDNDHRTDEQQSGPAIKLDAKDPRVPVIEQWREAFEAQPAWLRSHWHETHRTQVASSPDDDVLVVWLEPSPGIEPHPKAAAHPAWQAFESFTEKTRQHLARSESVFDGASIADDIDDGEADYVIPKMVPAGPAVTVAYGLPDHCKSAFAQKAAIVVASDTLDFDGVPVMHGRVLMVTADSGARKKHVILRMRRVCDRLGVSAEDRARIIERLVIVDDAVNLLEPSSVAKLLAKHPGPWAMIILDPLVKMVGGLDLAQAGVMTPALAGAMRMGIETGAAIMVVTHEGRGDKGRPFGSIFGDADATAILHVVRSFKGFPKNLDPVTVTVEKLKNDSAPDKPFAYRIDEAYLAPAGESAGKRSAPSAPIERPDMLARLPTEWRPVKGSIDLVDDLMPARLSKGKGGGRETLWRRLRDQWQAAGLIEQDDGRIRRVA